MSISRPGRYRVGLDSLDGCHRATLMKRILFFVAALAIAGCSADPPRTTPAPAPTSTTPAVDPPQPDEPPAPAPPVVDHDSDGVPDAKDCAPDDGTRWTMAAYSFRDADGDGHSAPAQGVVCLGDRYPPGYGLSPWGDDCDDNDRNVTSGDYAEEWRRTNTMFHEFGHSVRHTADGDELHWGWDNFRWAYARTHSGCEVFNTQYAFNEGWANYWGELQVTTIPNCTVPDERFLDWNERRVGERLAAMAVPVGHKKMVEILETNRGTIHSLRDFEEKYCLAMTTSNPFCTATKRPTRPQPASCPPGFNDDGATCRLVNVKGKPSYGRGAGVPPTDCGSKVMDAGLCYDRCRDGYKGVGPVCWQSCPSAFRDDGAFCAKPQPYGRGGGYPWQFGDAPFSLDGARARCERDHGAGRCEQDGAIIYPKCRAGFHAAGCCICSPNCVDGMNDIGVSCAKKSYGRGVGTVPTRCQGGMQMDAGLCYQPCKPDFNGVGPVCWGKCEDGFADHGATCYREPNILVKY
jgi:hypothetical protein